MTRLAPRLRSARAAAIAVLPVATPYVYEQDRAAGDVEGFGFAPVLIPAALELTPLGVDRLGEFGSADAEIADRGAVEDQLPIVSYRSDRELGVEWGANLANEGDVEGRTERPRNLVADGHAAARQGNDDGVAEVAADEIGGEQTPRLAPVGVGLGEPRIHDAAPVPAPISFASARAPLQGAIPSSRNGQFLGRLSQRDRELTCPGPRSRQLPVLLGGRRGRACQRRNRLIGADVGCSIHAGTQRFTALPTSRVGSGSSMGQSADDGHHSRIHGGRHRC